MHRYHVSKSDYSLSELESIRTSHTIIREDESLIVFECNNSELTVLNKLYRSMEKVEDGSTDDSGHSYNS